jgi:hypothetical protein
MFDFALICSIDAVHSTWEGQLTYIKFDICPSLVFIGAQGSPARDL